MMLLPGTGGVIGFLGRMDESRKGLAVLLRAFEVLGNFPKPLIGAVRLAELSTASVRDFRVRLTQKGCSAAMVRKLVSNLGSILADAMESGRVAQNVVRVQTPRQRRERGLAKRHEKRLDWHHQGG